MKNDIKYMKIAIDEAKKAAKKDEVPVGAVIVRDNKVISKAHNQKEKKKISFYHAEIIAIMKANKKLRSWRLNDCTIYVTLKPCDLCMAALKEARIGKIIYAIDPQKNKDHIAIVIEQLENYDVQVECRETLQSFFKNKRK